jgi:hypothetical protein
MQPTQIFNGGQQTKIEALLNRIAAGQHRPTDADELRRHASEQSASILTEIADRIDSDSAGHLAGLAAGLFAGEPDPKLIEVTNLFVAIPPHRRPAIFAAMRAERAADN